MEKTLSHKKCTCCGIEKLLDEFHKKLKGAAPACKACSSNMQRERRAAEPDAVKAMRREREQNGGRRTPTRYESRSGREGLRTQRKTKMRAGNGSKQTMTAS